MAHPCRAAVSEWMPARLCPWSGCGRDWSGAHGASVGCGPGRRRTVRAAPAPTAVAPWRGALAPRSPACSSATSPPWPGPRWPRLSLPSPPSQEEKKLRVAHSSHGEKLELGASVNREHGRELSIWNLMVACVEVCAVVNEFSALSNMTPFCAFFSLSRQPVIRLFLPGAARAR